MEIGKQRGVRRNAESNKQTLGIALIARAAEKGKKWPDGLMAKEMKRTRQPIEMDCLAHRSTDSLLVLGRLHELSQGRRPKEGHLNRGY